MPATKEPGSETRSDAIRFVLDGEVKTLRNVDPNTTVVLEKPKLKMRNGATSEVRT